MTEQKKAGNRRWAPWWLYLVVLLPANLAKQAALGDAPVALNVAATVALVGAGIVVITALYRAFASNSA
ncbi:hypothetical protein [Asanoa sp. NPDC050611]|uniref:hypothetical protein n=1 Tax=Asanoa sp. NPDC050611 TaxID=3157098 RepID=UPI0033D45D39